MNEQNTQQPNIVLSFLPVVILLLLFALSILTFGDECSSGPNQVVLLIGTAIVFIIAILSGQKYQQLEQDLIKGISNFIPACIILLLIGSLIAIWFLCGTVPTLIYYGVQIMNPTFFYPSVVIICALSSISIGSSWNTGATLGVACVGIAQALGLDLAITVGAVISGAYFGDKMSPLSETTNLASASGNVPLFKHIKNMIYTTIPSIVLATILFLIIGLVTVEAKDHAIDLSFINKIKEIFSINIFTLTPLVVLIYCARKRLPTLISIFIGIAVGIAIALIFQNETISKIWNADQSIWLSLKALWQVSYAGLSIHTDHETINKLLSGGGMNSMLNVVFIILSAMCFGTAMESSGCLDRIMKLMIKASTSASKLIISTLLTCFGVVVISGEQTMGIILPGRMYASIYQKHDLDGSVLTRTLEDGATITSVLIPWTTCGVFFSEILGINTLEYLPYCFFNIINPILAIIYAILGIKIFKINDPRLKESY